MHFLQPHLRLFSAVSFLLSWLAACDSTVEQPKPKRGTECAAACEVQHPEGVRLYRYVVSECACNRCTDDCRQSVCFDKQTPSDDCLPCVQESLEGTDCREHAGLFVSGCLDHEDCADFVGCITACEPIAAQ